MIAYYVRMIGGESVYRICGKTYAEALYDNGLEATQVDLLMEDPDF